MTCIGHKATDWLDYDLHIHLFFSHSLYVWNSGFFFVYIATVCNVDNNFCWLQIIFEQEFICIYGNCNFNRYCITFIVNGPFILIFIQFIVIFFFLFLSHCNSNSISWPIFFVVVLCLSVCFEQLQFNNSHCSQSIQLFSIQQI